jgi:hypothetical protein
MAGSSFVQADQNFSQRSLDLPYRDFFFGDYGRKNQKEKVKVIHGKNRVGGLKKRLRYTIRLLVVITRA